MAANPCIKLRNGQAVMSRLVPMRALAIRLPWLRASDFGVRAEGSRVFLWGPAFELRLDKQPAAMTPHDAFIRSHAHPFCFTVIEGLIAHSLHIAHYMQLIV